MDNPLVIEIKDLLQRIKSKTFEGSNIKVGIILSVAISFAIFLLISIFFNFTLSTDDYNFVAQRLHGENNYLNLENFYFARVPLWLIATYINFLVLPWSYNFVGMYFYFVIYAISFSLLAHYVVKSLGLKLPLINFILLTVVFLLYPTHYEILYWPTCMPYIIGLLSLSVALLCRHKIVSIILMAASFMFSEMYLIPALLLSLLPIINKDGKDSQIFKRLFSASQPWLIAVFVTLAFQITSSLTVSNPYPFPFSFDLAKIIFNIRYSVESVIGIHFYEMNEWANIIYWIAMAYIGSCLIANKKIGIMKLLILFFTCFIATAVHWFIGYTAPRALFGAQLYVNLILIYLLALFLTEMKIQQYALIMMIFFIFIAQSLFIFGIKDYNYHALEERQAALVKVARNCPEPCRITLVGLDHGLKRDWVLYKDYWIAFAKWTQYKNGIDKNIEYIVQE